MGIMWENTAPGTEFHRICAGIGLLQLGVVLVYSLFDLGPVNSLLRPSRSGPL